MQREGVVITTVRLGFDFLFRLISFMFSSFKIFVSCVVFVFAWTHPRAFVAVLAIASVSYLSYMLMKYMLEKSRMKHQAEHLKRTVEKQQELQLRQLDAQQRLQDDNESIKLELVKQILKIGVSDKTQLQIANVPEGLSGSAHLSLKSATDFDSDPIEEGVQNLSSESSPLVE